MACNKCGCSTPHRICRECERAERAENQAKHAVDEDWPDCPTCDGTTIAEGVRCADCRREDDEDGDDAPTCGHCGSEDTEKRSETLGFEVRYIDYRCNACGRLGTWRRPCGEQRRGSA